MSDAQTPQQLFDPIAYLDITLTDPTEKRPPLTPGDYTAIIGEVTDRKWQGLQRGRQSKVNAAAPGHWRPRPAGFNAL